MTELPRRRLLAATGTALTGAVAGCMGSDDGNGDGGNGNGDENESVSADPKTGSETTETESGTLLGEISLENIDDEAHTIDVIVEFGDGPEHWSTHELAEDNGAELERNWPTEPGSFSVMFRLDGGEPTQVTPARWNDPDCVNIFAMIGRNGELTVPSTTDGGPCGDGDATVDDAEE